MPLLTIVFTDVVESSATKRHVSLGRDDRERDHAYLENVQTRHFDLIRASCQAHHGKEVSTSGDAFFLTFEDPVEGVRCAVDIQERLAAQPIDTPRGPLRLRIGVHSGFPEFFEDSWHGTDVDTAARVEAAATERQILLSSRTYELVRHMTDVRFLPRGDFALKGVDRITLWEADWDGKGPRPTSARPLPARQWRSPAWLSIAMAVVVVIGAVEVYRAHVDRRARTGAESGPAANERRSVAVLQFKNQGSQDDAWLGTALSEMVTEQLAAGDQLRAIPGDDVARTYSDLSLAGMFSFGQVLLSKIQANLGSDYIVSGSYTLTGDTAARGVRISLQLQDTHSGRVLSSSSYDGTLDALSDVAKRIATDVRAALTVPAPTDIERTQADAAAPSNPQALRLYAEGLDKLRAFDLLEARDRLEHAIQLEPNYALAHAALADTLQLLGYDQLARDEAKRAADLSGDLSQKDRRSIDARYRAISADWEEAAKIYGALWEVYNDEPSFALEEAHAQAEAGHAQDALATLDALRRSDSRAKNDPRTDYEEALAAEKLSDVTRQHAAAAKAAKEASQQGAILLAAEAYWQDCNALLAMGDTKGAEGSCQQANQWSDSSAAKQVKARSLTALSNLMDAEGKPEQVMALRKQALEDAQEIGSRKDIIGALMNLANLQSTEGRIADAQSNERQAIQIARDIGDKQQLLDLQNNLASDSKTEGEYQDAKAQYEDSLQTARDIGDQGGISTALQNLGSLCLLAGDLACAEKDVKAALAISQAAHLQATTASGFENLGDIQLVKGSFGEARNSYENELALFTKEGDKADIAGADLALAKMAFEQGKIADAENEARQAIQGFQAEKLADNEADAHSTLARCLTSQGKLADAAKEVANAASLEVQDRTIRISLGITEAQLSARSGEIDKARQDLDSQLMQAKEKNLVGLELEARLASAALDSHSQSNKAALAALQDDARASGYLLVAAKAQHLLAKN